MRASRTCERLARRALVRRETDPDDARTLRLCLTPAGARVVHNVSAARRAALQPMVARLTPAKAEQLSALLTELIQVAEDVAEQDLWALGWGG